MAQSTRLSLAIAAALSMSALTGCSSISTKNAQAIPTQASASSPTIVTEKVAFLSGTRTRHNSQVRYPSYPINNGQTRQVYVQPAAAQSYDDDSDLVYAAQLLLGNSVAPSRAAPQHRVAPRRIEKHYQPARQTAPQTYKVSQRARTYDPILDNPAYRQELLEMAGLAPKRATAQRAVQRPQPVARVQHAVATQRPVVQRVSNTAPRFVPAQAVRTNVGQSRTPYAPQEDMWNQIRAGYHMGNNGWRKQVQHFARVYGKKPERLQRIANRSTDYLHIVVTELKRRGMPTELALLPFVESAYVNTAHSHAGASGMWQFIPSTGRIYGLKQNSGFDGRMDALESTRAALDYLQKLHRQFKGDWFLALAAYNAGEGRVSRAIKYNRARGRKTDYWNLRLPRETREYVPRLLAYKEIIQRPEAYGFRLPRTPNVPKLAEIHVNKPVNLRKAAIHAGLAPDTLTALNPNFLKGVTTPRISKRILLPISQAGRLAHVINWLPAEKPVSTRSTKKRVTKRYTKKRAQPRYKTHRVKRGETLYRIALKHGLTVNKLKRINGMRSNTIRTGSRLKLI
ncbi:LysM peptidoglycan-binding domain-containing protein [Leucothrix sargassi]|nr:LysM peptidoglycan-binding domain-containing protein [Leucothrix sargassi]